MLPKCQGHERQGKTKTLSEIEEFKKTQGKTGEMCTGL